MTTAALTYYATVRFLVWSRADVLAYLGDPSAYDVDAIIADMDATGDSLEEVAARHQSVSFWPAA